MSESYPAALGPDRTMRRRDARAFWRAFGWALAAVALLAWIKALEILLDKPLDGLGVVPGTFSGLIGVLTAPLVHGSVSHLLANSFPLLLLGTLARYAYPRALNRALPLIWIVSGIGTWLIGRPPVHVGASGIAHGLMFFLFFMGLLRRDRLAIVTALVVFFLYGGMLLSVLPREQHVSFEYHAAGAIAGVLAAILFFRTDPMPARKRYSWEDEEVEAEGDDEYELPRPKDVPVLWVRPEPADATSRVVRLAPRNNGRPTIH
jgi:membrane associated rhomboid family serine protease